MCPMAIVESCTSCEDVEAQPFEARCHLCQFCILGRATSAIPRHWYTIPRHWRH